MGLSIVAPSSTLHNYSKLSDIWLIGPVLFAFYILIADIFYTKYRLPLYREKQCSSQSFSSSRRSSSCLLNSRRSLMASNRSSQISPASEAMRAPYILLYPSLFVGSDRIDRFSLLSQAKAAVLPVRPNLPCYLVTID